MMGPLNFTLALLLLIVVTQTVDTLAPVHPKKGVGDSGNIPDEHSTLAPGGHRMMTSHPPFYTTIDFTTSTLRRMMGTGNNTTIGRDAFGVESLPDLKLLNSGTVMPDDDLMGRTATLTLDQQSNLSNNNFNDSQTMFEKEESKKIIFNGSRSPLRNRVFEDVSSMDEGATHSDENTKSHNIAFERVSDYISKMIGRNLPQMCTGRCGQAFDEGLFVCSCKLSCFALKTCCVDFFNACVGTLYSRSQVENSFSWLNLVEKICESSNTVIASCRADVNVSSEEYDVDNINSSDAVKETYSTSNLIDLMRSQASVGRASHILLSQELEWLLSKLLIRDQSTGLDYLNASVFQCNGGHWELARLWGIKIYHDQRNTSRIAITNGTATLQSILSLSAIRKIRPRPHHYSNVCPGNRFISHCPPQYSDGDVAEACRRTTLPSSFVNMTGHVDSLLWYKNPFCLVCNKGTDLTAMVIMFAGFGEREKGLSDVDVTVRVPEQLSLIVNYTRTNNVYSIALFRCSFDAHEASGREEEALVAKNVSDEDDITREEAIQATDSDAISQHGFAEVHERCQIMKCLFVEYNPLTNQCVVSVHMALLLPPTAIRLKTDTLNYVFDLFSRRFAQALNQLNVRFLESFVEEKGHPFLFNNMSMQYIVIFKAQTDTYFENSDFDDPDNEMTTQLWSGSPFPFHRSQYACIVYHRHYSLYAEPLEGKPFHCWLFGQSMNDTGYSHTTGTLKSIERAYVIVNVLTVKTLVFLLFIVL